MCFDYLNDAEECILIPLKILKRLDNFNPEERIDTLQMLTDKLLINYYFHMLLLQVKMCNLFKDG